MLVSSPGKYKETSVKAKQGWVSLIERASALVKETFGGGLTPRGKELEWVEKNEQKYKNGTGFPVSVFKVTEDFGDEHGLLCWPKEGGGGEGSFLKY